MGVSLCQALRKSLGSGTGEGKTEYLATVAAVMGFEMLFLPALKSKVRWYRVLHALMGCGAFLFVFYF